MIEIRSNLINDFNSFKLGREEPHFYRKILVDLEILQTSIYYKFIYATRDFLYDDLSEININTFEQWISRFVLFSKEIEGIRTGMIGLIEPITDIYRQKHQEWHPRLDEEDVNDFIKFYGSFFEKTEEIRKRAEAVNDKIYYYYYKNWFNAISESYSSKVCLRFVIVSILFFGLIIPLYMIQPLHLDKLACNIVFYMIICFILPVNFALLLLSYLFRYKTQPFLNVNVSQDHDARNGWPNRILIGSVNDSRTPLSDHKIDCDIYLNNTKIRSKTLSSSLAPYGKHIDIVYNINDLRILHEIDNNSKELKLLIRQFSYRLKLGDTNFFIKGKKSSCYLWNKLSLEWGILSPAV